MKEFVEKLIERLEEKKKEAYDKWDGGASFGAYAMSIEIVNHLAEEYGKDTNVTTKDCSKCSRRSWYQRGYADAEKNNGWISVEERLPDKRDWYLAVFQEADTGFVGIPFIADYLMGVHTNYTTEDGWIIANCTDIEEDRAEYYKKLKCIAWQPLPTPFVQK